MELWWQSGGRRQEGFYIENTMYKKKTAKKGEGGVNFSRIPAGCWRRRQEGTRKASLLDKGEVLFEVKKVEERNTANTPLPKTCSIITFH